MNMAIFTLMYAGLATAWNLLGGLLRLPVARSRGLLRHRRLRDRHRRSNTRGRGRVHAVPGPAAASGSAPRSSRSRSPGSRCAPGGDVRDRHDHVAVRRAAAGVQPAWPDRTARRASRCPCRPSRSTTLRASLLLGHAGGLRRRRCWRCWYVRGSKLGLMLLAIRDDEDRARGVGVRRHRPSSSPSRSASGSRR